MKTIRFRDLGLVGYKQAWDMQEKTLEAVIRRKLGKNNLSEDHQVVFFCEHPHVYTLGKSGQEGNLLVDTDHLKKIGAELYRINRGGDITYHGPGQIVGYPVIDLDEFGMGARDYINRLEESVIRLLQNYGIVAGRKEGATGVWIDPEDTGSGRKICAIGVRISRSVTMHGFALNVAPDLRYFNYINPCGFTGRNITSMKKELGRHPGKEQVKNRLKQIMAEVFAIEWKN